MEIDVEEKDEFNEFVLRCHDEMLNIRDLHQTYKLIKNQIEELDLEKNKIHINLFYIAGYFESSELSKKFEASFLAEFDKNKL
jgi:predicted RNA-binding protein